MSYPTELREKIDRSDGLSNAERVLHQQAALISALDSAITVIYETREFVRKHPESFGSVQRQALGDVLERLGRLCFSVATELARRPQESSKDKAQNSKGEA